MIENYMQYYNTDTKVLEMPDDKFIIPSGGLGKVIFDKMCQHKNKIAQIDPETDTKETYDQLVEKIVRTAIELKSKIQPDDIMLLCSDNHLNCVVPYMATLVIGGVCVCIDPAFAQDEMSYMINLIEPKIVFVVQSAKEKIKLALKGINWDCKVVVFGEDFESTYLSPKEDENTFKPINIEDSNKTAIIFFSSGSTGFPKAICLNHAMLLYAITSLGNSINAYYTSLYWISAMQLTLISLLQGDWTLKLHHFDAKKLWKYIYKYEVKALFLAPAMAIDFFNDIPEDVSKCPLKTFLTGGSNASIHHLKKYVDTLPTASIMYGYAQTEIGITLRFCNMSEMPDKIGSVGTPRYEMHYKIVDPETEEVLGFNQPGELRLKTKWVMNGYYKMDSSDQFDEYGFFKTGDICYYDEDFCFYIVDRVKEMFKYRSWHIIPAKLENILVKHPAVELCIVVGVPHPTDEYHPMAIVKCKSGYSVSEAELCKFVNDQVDERYHLRAGVAIVNDFIYTQTSKIQRRKTRDMVIKNNVIYRNGN